MSKLGFHCNRFNHIHDGIITNGLGRGEFYNFPAEELPLLRKEIHRRNILSSIHAPLVRPEWYPDPPTWSFLCDTEKGKRELSMRMIRETLEVAGEYNAEYVVVHFPSPIADGKTSDYSELKAIAMESCYLLDKLVDRYCMPVHIEGFGPSPFLNTDFLNEVFSLFHNLRYCFDLGHMNLAAERGDVDLNEFGHCIKLNIGSIHLWNNRGIEDYRQFRHIPVHPSQQSEHGWADVATILNEIGGLAHSIIFESSHKYPESLGDYDYRDGVEWVKQLVTA